MMTGIVAFYGRRGSGKTTLAKALAKYAPDIYTVSMASPLRAAVTAFLKCLGLPERLVHEDKDKAIDLSRYGWLTGRDLLLQIGRVFGTAMPDWRTRYIRALTEADVCRLFVIDDLRLLDEYLAVREAGGIVIRLTRRQDAPDANGLLEGLLDDQTFDLTLEPDLTEQQSIDTIVEFLRRRAWLATLS